MRELVAGPLEIGLVDLVMVGVVRLVTHRRIFTDPAPTATALSLVDGLRSAPRARSLQATSGVRDRLRLIDPLQAT